MLNISLSQSSSGETVEGLPGQMAVKDAFNQELYRSRTNGGLVWWSIANTTAILGRVAPTRSDALQ